MAEPIERPLCLVRGMIAPRAMCGYVIVGCKFCGYDGECEHKSEQPAANEGEKQNG